MIVGRRQLAETVACGANKGASRCCQMDRSWLTRGALTVAQGEHISPKQMLQLQSPPLSDYLICARDGTSSE